MGNLRAVIKVLCILLGTLALVPVQLLLCLIPRYRRERFYLVPRLWHRLMCWIIGLRVTYKGVPSTGFTSGVLYASNHISYLDIFVLGARLPGVFVAKSEIAGWPVFGFLATLQGTIFIKRERREVSKQQHLLSKVLSRGISLTLFPEGTTSNGFDILPFKPSLFQVAIDNQVAVMPIRLSYTHLDGAMIADQEMMDVIAWYRDETTMLPHLWRLLKHRTITVKVTIGDAVPVTVDDSRRVIAERVCNIVKDLGSVVT